MRKDYASQAGFTLVELLVVMTLTSLVMLALFGAMRSMGQTETRIDARIARADNFRTAVAFLRATLDRVSVRKIDGLQAGVSQLPFSAAPGEMIWVGVMPARYGPGGRHFFRLSVEKTNAGDAALVIRFAPWINGARGADWASSNALVLVDKLISFNVQYQDTRSQGSEWRADWPFTDRLPSAVSLAIGTQFVVWPEVVISMRPLPGMDDLSNAITAGPER